MADDIKIYKKCKRCNGTGIYQENFPDPTGEVLEDPCLHCMGAGFFEIGKIDNNFFDTINDIKDKCDDILDKCKDILEQLTE